MNKTVNINLGGLFFHIDEDAYQKLTRYFDAIKRSLSGSGGKDEIMKDIEIRISEIFSENQKSDKHVISIGDVEAMIQIMGQPEDYILEEDEAPKNQNEYTYKKSKKLYRDTDRNILGGVAAGLGHYFNIDTIWIRLILILLFIPSVGTMTLIYILLWILIPEARTTSQKLEMTGEPVNLSNIEKKIREEIENVSDKIKNADYEKMGNQAKKGAEKVASAAGEFLNTLFSIIAKIIGVIIVLTALGFLTSLIIGLLTFGTTTFFIMPWNNHIDAVLVSEFPIWLISLLTFFAIGIPLFFLLLLGLKLIINNMKSIGSIAKYLLIAIWVLSIGFLIAFGIKQATEQAYDGKVIQKEVISILSSDTLEIKFRYNDYFAKNVDHRTSFDFVHDENGNEFIYSNNITLRIAKTDETAPYIQIERKADGKSMGEARNRAEKIEYNYILNDNKLVLDNYLITDTSQKYRNQKVEIVIYLPEGFFIKPDRSVSRYISYYYSDLHFKSGYDDRIYLLKKGTLNCANCPDETVSSISEGEKTTITIETQGVKIEKGTSVDDRKFKGLEINDDGVIIKTQ